jgi:hypothetical protein
MYDGIPYIGMDGSVQRYILPGANPLRKDLYVEVDAHAGRSPIQNGLNRVIAAFDSSPVPAVPGLSGGLPGITLHIEVDDTNLTDRAYVAGDSEVGWEDFHVDKAEFFGSASERAAPDWEQMKVAKAQAYRYCIFARTIPCALGRAELDDRKGGNDFMIGLGLFQPPPGRTLEDAQAAAFMHELGHSLGLYHGGGDGYQNFNPNH